MRFSRMLLLSLFVLFVSTQIFSMGEISPVDKGLKAEIINELKDAESKIATLANDIPQAKYTWRPEDGVRSVSEVILHVAGANYFFLSFLGIKMPDGAKMDSDFDKKTTNKEEILEFVKKSYSFTYDKIMSLKDKDLEKSVDFFGMKLTTRQLMIKAVGHNHEHLGQLIAYARMNGVTPSWSKKGN